MLFAYELDSVQPAQTGEFYELYAIAAAVLGGCSLRGGQQMLFLFLWKMEIDVKP